LDLHPVAAVQYTFTHKHPVAAVKYTFTHKHPVAAVQYTFTHKHPVAAVQYTFTHKHPVATVQYTFTHKEYTECRERNIHYNKKKKKYLGSAGRAPYLRVNPGIQIRKKNN
jgi:hypothetical protein